MPEELNLLPCPICGKPAVATTDHMLMEMVYCCGIAAESVSEWNALPRALTWTTEPPKVAGHYWCRYRSEGKENWSVAYVPNVTNWDKLDMAEHDRIEWAGPIPMPQEPTL